MNKRMLVVSGHGADWCTRSGGTLIKYHNAGWEIKILALTFGERGESPEYWAKNPNSTVEACKECRKKEAQAAAAAIWMARSGNTMAEIRAYTQAHFYPLERTVDQIRPTYQFADTCQNTVPPAIQCFLESTSFEDALRNAISLGGDSDTLADITCAIAWPYYARQGKDAVMRQLEEHAKSLLPDPLRQIMDVWEQRFGSGE